MTNSVRLLEGAFSKGLEAVTRLTRSSHFTCELGEAICAGNEDRAVRAMRRELLPDPLIVATSNGSGGPYRSAAGGVLPPDHVIVSFAYAPTPSMPDLKKVYKGGVSGIFDGRKWQKHAVSIMAGSKMPGEHIVWLAAPPREMLDDGEAIIAWGDGQRTEIAPNGYRPIMGENELLDLHTAHPILCKRFWMAALGSFALGDNYRRGVAVLGADDGGPCLDARWFGHEWREGDRFPLIPR